MRTAKKIIQETFPNIIYRLDGLMQGDINANDIVLAINKARKEAIEECAMVATVTRDPLDGHQPFYYVNKQSILDLIDELK
jgi:hypothetical protein